jgi:hypothetical protein
MTRVRVAGFTISLDGYGAGPIQDIGNPLGVGGADLIFCQLLTRRARSTHCILTSLSSLGSFERPRSNFRLGGRAVNKLPVVVLRRPAQHWR